MVKKKVIAVSAKAVKSAARAKDLKAVSKVNSHANGFVEFIRDQGVVGLAIGLAIGSVASSTVKSIVEGFVNPLVQLAIGTHSQLQTQVWHADLWGRKADFMWGAALSSLITLVATAFVIYLIVHFAKLDRLKKADKN